MTELEMRDDSGASAVEYGLIVFAIAAVIVAMTFALGRVVNETYSDSCDVIATSAVERTCAPE
ncbi:MAG: Flp family type IVb pilin [Actinomycetes bacterium]